MLKYSLKLLKFYNKSDIIFRNHSKGFLLMKKIDPTVKKETLYILLWTLILSFLMEAVFILAGLWNIAVLIGNIIGGAAAVGNFFLLGLSVQSALDKDKKEAKDLMKISQGLRLFGLIAVVLVAYILSKYVPSIEINIIALVIPYLFPRVAMAIRTLTIKKGGAN